MPVSSRKMLTHVTELEGFAVVDLHQEINAVRAIQMSEIKNTANSGNFAAGWMKSVTNTAKSVEKQVVQVAKAAEKQITTGAKAVKDSLVSGYSDVNIAKQEALRKFADSRPDTMGPKSVESTKHVKHAVKTKNSFGVIGGLLNIGLGINTARKGNSWTEKETWKGLTNAFGGAADVVTSGMEFAGKAVPQGLEIGGKALGYVGAAFDAHTAIVAGLNGNEVEAWKSGLDAFAGASSATGHPIGLAFGVPYSATRAVMECTEGDKKVTNFFYQQTEGAIADGAASKLRQDELNKFSEFSSRGDLNQQVSINRRSAVAARVEARELVKTATGGEKARLERLLKELNTGIQYATEREAEYKGLV